MPYFMAVCGVRPNCANTGMPARVSARTASGKSAAPSSLSMSAPPSLTSRIAARSGAATPPPAFGKIAGPIEFAHGGAAFLDQPDGGPQRRVDAFLHRAERHVAAH